MRLTRGGFAKGVRSKYGAHPVFLNGRRFASKAEGGYAVVLQEQLRLGLIAHLDYQPRVKLTTFITYVPDFKYTAKTGIVVYVDVKGFETPEFKLKEKLWIEFGPGRLIIIKKRAKGYITDRVVDPIHVCKSSDCMVD